MFGKKKMREEIPVENNANLSLTLIPPDFYGGNDPAVYAGNAKKTGQSNSVSQSFVSSGEHWWQTRATKIILLLIISLSALGLISWYYINDAQKSALPAPVENVVANNSTPTSTVLLPTPTALPSSTIIVTPTVALLPSTPTDTIQFPSLLLPQATDLDQDGLSDTEEEIYNTDAGALDSDADGFGDGQEIEHLYNPSAATSSSLLDSGLVKEYINSTWHYRVYYPRSWEIGPVDSTADQVLFSSITGDFVEVRVIPKLATQSFPDWFASVAKGEDFARLNRLTNRFGQTIFVRRDNLVGYLPSDTSVVVLIYHAGPGNTAAFSTTIKMMMQSLRVVK